MTRDEARAVLTERRNYLTGRIEAKEKVGWETQWDRRERDAITTLLQEGGK